MNQLPAWSYSMLDTFNNCPRQTYHCYILREKEPPSPAQLQGIAVHNALEQRIKGTPLPEEFARYAPMAESVARLCGNGTKLYAELKMGLTRTFEPCAFFYENVWGRSAADVVLKKNDTIMVFDWKTGKKREKPDQMHIMALFLFKHFPKVDKITGVNLWLESNEVGTPYTFTRAMQADMWRETLVKILAMEKALQQMAWPEKPSGLCGFCAVKQCRYNRS